MKNLIKVAVLLAGLAPAIAAAQSQPNLSNLPAGTVIGRLLTGPGPAQAFPFALLKSSGGFISGPQSCSTSNWFNTVSAAGVIGCSQPSVADISGFGTGIATALGVNPGTAGSLVVNGGALGSPSSVGTLPAHTLGGTVSGGGNQINNVIIGTSTPLAGSFTTLATGAQTVTSASSAAVSVGPNGATNPVFQINSATASQAAGLKITGAVTAGRVDMSVTDSGTNSSLGINAKGSGDISIAGTSTGGITLARATTLGTITGSTQCLHVNSTGIISGTGLDCGVAASQVTASLGSDVALNNTANYFDGPSVAQGTTGTWFASGTATLTDTTGVAAFICKLWDGTTVIASGRITSTGASNPTMVSLSGYLASPAANIRISCRDSATTTGSILFNNSGNSKDSTISVLRIQ